MKTTFVETESEATSTALTDTRKLQKKQDVDDRPERHVYRHWTLEALIFLLASGLFLGIIILLLNVRGSYVDQWPFPIELNTLIAILSTVMRTCLVIVLEEILSQSKWSWFRRKARPLDQLQTYDNASRGIVGSFKLLIMLRGFRDRLAVVAALVMMSSLSISPFAQQASATTGCAREQKNDQATIAAASFLPPLMAQYQAADTDIWGIETLHTGFDYFVEPDVKGLISNAFVADAVQDNATLFNCPTNECTFDSEKQDSAAYSTVGICNQCFDSAEFAVFYEPGGGADWAVMVGNTVVNKSESTGSYKNQGLMTSNYSTLDFAGSGLSSEFLDAAHFAILNATIMIRKEEECDEDCLQIISEGGSPEGMISAATCSLYPCIKHMKSRVKGSSLYEDIISTELIEERPGMQPYEGKKDAGFIDMFLHAFQSPCVINGESHEFEDLDSFADYNDWDTASGVPFTDSLAYLNESDAKDCFYGFSWGYLRDLSDWLQDEFIVDECGGLSGGTDLVYSLGCEKKWWLDPLWLGTGASRYDNEDGRIALDDLFEHVQGKFDNLAAALTNYFRTIQRPKANFTNLPHDIIGESWETTLCVEFNWIWLFWPGLLHLLTGLGLVWIVVRDKVDHSQATWKSSFLPLLIFGLERTSEHSRAGGQGLPSEDIKDIRQFSEKTIVQLKQSELIKRSAFVEEVPNGEVIDGPASNTWARQGYEAWLDRKRQVLTWLRKTTVRSH